jgi:uncharacterized protein (TIGR04255 family)
MSKPKSKKIKTPSKVNFDSPPVREVVCGVQFHLLNKFLAVDVGKLYERYSDRYPTTRENPALATAIEQVPGLAVEVFTPVPVTMPRSVFVAPETASVVQVQRDAFYYNWRRADEHYPSYETVIKSFRNELDIFIRFLEDNKLGSLVPVQFELTYVNEIPVETSGVRLLKDFQWDSSFKRQEPESINLGATFLLENSEGRLHSNFRTLFGTDGRLIYQWTITVRGCTNPRSAMSVEKLRPWMDNANKWIYKQFIEMSTDEAQIKIWGRE